MAELNTLAPKKWVANYSGAAPTIDTTDGVSVGDFAIDSSNDAIWRCTDNTDTAAVWASVGAGGTVQGVDGTYDIQPTNEGATAGNARGENSVDLCTSRVSAAYVCAGANSAAVGGQNIGGTGANSFYAAGSSNHSNSGLNCLIAGSSNNTNSGDSCVIGGSTNNTNSGEECLIAGYLNNGNSGDRCVIGGMLHLSNSGSNCLITGYGHTSNTGNYCQIGGDSAASNALDYARIHGGGASARIIDLVAKASTTDATPKAITLGGAVEGAVGSIIIPVNTTWGFTVSVVARRTDVAGTQAFYKFEGCIENEAGTVAIVGTVVKSVIAEDDAALDVNITADATYDALRIMATGIAAQTFRWTARIDITQVD